MRDLGASRPGDPDELGGYRILGRLGSGGQGVVYLGTGSTGERVAIKQMWLEDERDRTQFVKEVAAARRVAPFCTAQVMAVGTDGPTSYIVSEYIEGRSLQQQISQFGPMVDGSLQRLAIGTITALAAIHEAGVVHRDFKPANVMLSSEGPRVIDFGIARDLSTETTVTSRIFGTPSYMAPEQLDGTGVGPAADIFAWACVLAFAATGRAPFEAENMMVAVQRIATKEPSLIGVPDYLVPVLRTCLKKDAAQRPSAQQVLSLLLGSSSWERDAEQVLAEAAYFVHEDKVPIPARPWPRPRDRFRRKRWWYTAIGGALVVAAVLLGTLQVKARRSDGAAPVISGQALAHPVSGQVASTVRPSAASPTTRPTPKKSPKAKTHHKRTPSSTQSAHALTTSDADDDSPTTATGASGPSDDATTSAAATNDDDSSDSGGGALLVGKSSTLATYTSPAGTYSLVQQTDGNLVLYRNSDHAALWASWTKDTTPGPLTLTSAGNLVLYDADHQKIWASGSSGKAAKMDVRDDGNFEIVDAGGNVIWDTT